MILVSNKNIVKTGRLLERYNKYMNKLKGSLHQRLIIYLFFVLLASVFWFFRALNETYKADISYPVRYINFPKDKVVVGRIPERLTLTVEAVGYTILKHRMRPRLRLNFDLAHLKLNKIGKDSSYILTQVAIPELSKSLNNIQDNLKILDVKPDTIFFHFTEMISKKVNVVPDIPDRPSLLAKQYMLNGPVMIRPDSITISGPGIILDTISRVLTVNPKISFLTDSFQRKLKIKKTDQVNYSSNEVELIIPVDKYTESSFSNIPIKVVNMPDTLNIKMFPPSVRVTYLVTLSNFEKVTPGIFKAYVDFNESKAGTRSKLKVKLEPLPDYVHSPAAYPSSVEYLIEK